MTVYHIINHIINILWVRTDKRSAQIQAAFLGNSQATLARDKGRLTIDIKLFLNCFKLSSQSHLQLYSKPFSVIFHSSLSSPLINHTDLLLLTSFLPIHCFIPAFDSSMHFRQTNRTLWPEKQADCRPSSSLPLLQIQSSSLISSSEKNLCYHPISSRTHESSTSNFPFSTLCFIQVLTKEAFIGKPQITSARKADRLTANLHVSLHSSKSSPWV